MEVLMSVTPQIPSAARPAMQAPPGEEIFITPAEWRWLTIVSAVLLVAAFAPMILVAAQPPQGWQFTGVLYNFLDGGSYLSKMRLGFEGGWLVTFLHNPQPIDSAFIQTLYPALGHVARLTGLPMQDLFHVMRALASAAMYAAIYALGAVIWTRVSTRRLFFAIAVIGSGVGWLLGPLQGRVDYPDFTLLPEAFPFTSTLMNVHFPLAIAVLALLCAQWVLLLRPGGDGPALTRSTTLSVFCLSLLAGVLYPQAMVPFGLAAVGTLGLRVLRRHVRRAQVLALAALMLPLAPLGLLVVVTVSESPGLSAWNAQNVTAAPDPLTFALGFGLPLLLALPAIVRALRRLGSDSDQMMLFWLAAIVLCVALPTNIQRRFAAGIMLPIAFFAARALVDFWLPRVGAPLRRPAVLVGLLLMGISPVLYLILPAAGARTAPEQSSGVMLQQGYLDAFAWIEASDTGETVVLAAPAPSAWIPGYTGHRVVYGHPYETLQADTRRAEAQAWYALPAGPQCSELLDRYAIALVMVGPQERALGPAGCAETLNLAAEFGAVQVYVR
jgi:hypothetical protein